MIGATIEPTDVVKRVATARARAALQCVVLHVMCDDEGHHEYVATRGPWTRAFVCLDDLEAWLDRMEGK